MEQYQDKGNQGAWTDIYALGASMYFMMTGNLVPDCMSRLENPALPSANELHIQNSVWQILNKCLKMDIADRYQSAAELKADIDKVRHSHMSAPTSGSNTDIKNSRQTMELYKQQKSEQNRKIKKKANLFPVIAIILVFLLALTSVIIFGVRRQSMSMPGGPPMGEAPMVQSD